MRPGKSGRLFLYAMSRFHSYLNTSVKLIDHYKGELPFALFLKNFFSAEKKYGSKDRKQIAALCYNYFRLGFAMKNFSVDERITLATFLCEQTPTDFLGKIDAELNEQVQLPINEKLHIVKEKFLIPEIFPFKEYLSDAVNIEKYCLSMLTQPLLFLRIRPQSKVTTLKKLEKAKLNHQLLNGNCIQLQPATNAEDYFIIDKEIVIQDYSSQQVLNYLRINETVVFGEEIKQTPLSCWDCCAASGGKSILLYDVLKRKIDLTISDIRLAIVMNLHQRFKKANLKEYKYFIADIGNNNFKPPATNYQLIICDAPCTGSGTWGRTPEQLCLFKPSTIKEYSDLQKRIVTNVLPHLKNDGIFVYITCSVFKEENEAIALFIKDTFKIEMLHQEIFKGFDKRADTLFVSIFKNSLS